MRFIKSSIIIGLMAYGTAAVLTGAPYLAILAWGVGAFLCFVFCLQTFYPDDLVVPLPALPPRYSRSAALAASPGHYTDEEWRDLCAQYKHRCLACGSKGTLTADHVIPLYRGGPDTIDNIQPLCKPCNSSKGTRTTDYRTRRA